LLKACNSDTDSNTSDEVGIEAEDVAGRGRETDGVVVVAVTIALDDDDEPAVGRDRVAADAPDVGGGSVGGALSQEGGSAKGR
jgi:hypothetical protein